jgi:hypothetical protein
MLGVLCTGVIITRPSQVLAKISGQQAQYQSRPNGDRRCSEYSFFIAPVSCQTRLTVRLALMVGAASLPEMMMP